MDREEFFRAWSGLHGNVPVTGFIKGWLTISFLLVKPLHFLKISPDLITYLGLGLGVLTWYQSERSAAIFLVLLSLIADGIDGSLAIVAKKVTLWGAELDSVVDRVVEFFWALTFYRIGAPVLVSALAWTAALIQEYVRARAAGLGHSAIGVVTICERPVRAIFLAVALLEFSIGLKAVTFTAILWLVMQLIALVVVLRDSYSALRLNNRLSN